MTSPADRAQGLPLWALPSASSRNPNPNAIPGRNCIDRPSRAPVVNQTAQASAHRGRQLIENGCRRFVRDPHLAQQPAQMLPALLSILRRPGDSQPRSQPAPQRRRHQQLRPPSPQTSPFTATATPEAEADGAGRFLQNQMPVQCFDDHCRRIPPPRMQPIRQTAHRVAAIPAQIPPHPNDNPSLTQTADLTPVQTVPLHPYASAISRQLPALRTESRPKLFNRRRARTSRA